MDKWHDLIGDPTLADAIFDRLVHSACKLNLKGESMRKKRGALTDADHPSSRSPIPRRFVPTGVRHDRNR